MNRLLTNLLARRPWMQDFQGFTYGFTQAPEGAPEGRDVEIAERLIPAYRRATQQRHPLNRGDDVWARFVETHYGEMIALIEQGDARGLAAYLRALPRQGAGHGYFQGKVTFERIKAQPSRHRERALWLLDHLVALAEALGVLRYRCPEQGTWDTPPFETVEALRSEIEQALSLPITLPPFFDGFFALEPKTRPIHLRTLIATYAVRQVLHLLGLFGAPAPASLHVAEVGAGLGYTAFVGRRLGIARYTLYDLPEVNVAQGFFLLKMLGEREVALFGEPHAAPVTVQPSAAFETQPQHVDATLNIDSLPEIDPHIMDRFLAGISARSRYFYSINQEAPRPEDPRGPRRSARESAAGHPALVPLLRYPNWIRAGYVEELFRTEEARLPTS